MLVYSFSVSCYVVNNALFVGCKYSDYCRDDKNEFEFKPAGIVIRFDVENGKLTLHQRGMDFELVKH